MLHIKAFFPNSKGIIYIVAANVVQYRFFGKARAQKVRKLGLSGLLASFPYIDFAHLIGQIYVFFRVLNDAFHRGKNPDLCTLWQKGVGENGDRFAEEW